MQTEWREYPDCPKYMVSGDGRVRGPRGGELALFDGGRGYLCFNISTDFARVKLCRVHRAVAEAFIPNPSNLPVVRHRNDVKTDNRVENLAWGVAHDNTEDAIKNRIGIFRQCPDGLSACTRCRQLKPLSCFTPNKACRNGVTSQCRDCFNESAKQRRASSRSWGCRAVGSAESFECLTCKQQLSASAFRLAKNGASYRARCRQCCNEADRAKRAARGANARGPYKIG